MILYDVRVIRYDILIRYFLNLFVCLIIVIIFKNSKTFSKIKLSPFPVSFKDILAFFHVCFPIFMFFFCVGGGGDTAWKVSVFGVFLVHIFPHLDWTRGDPPYLSVSSLNAGKNGPEKLRIRTLFLHWKSQVWSALVDERKHLLLLFPRYLSCYVIYQIHVFWFSHFKALAFYYEWWLFPYKIEDSRIFPDFLRIIFKISTVLKNFAKLPRYSWQSPFLV